MKLLGWMHRKLMQNSTDSIKNYTIGNHPTCFSIQTLPDEQNYYINPPKTSTHSNIKYERSPNTFETTSKVGKVPYQEESFDEPFHFLSIGTFGMELLNTDPPTPTLPMPVETTSLTDQQPIKITENDLSLINYKLGKFLEAEETEICNDSSERSSQSSIKTLTDQGHVQMVACPLQNYNLFEASVELAEADKEVDKTRTSLEELFKKNNIVDDYEKGEEVAEHEGRKGNHVAHSMKKVVKRFNPTSSSCTAAGFDNDAAVFKPIKKKLSKNLVKMLHKKVSPEEMIKKQFFKVSTKGNKKLSNKKHISSEDDDHHIHIGASNKFDPSSSKKSKKNSTMKLLFWTGICRGASSPVNNTGHWIKTDSDYLVLEL